MSGYYFWTLRPDVLLAGLGAIPIIGDILRHTVSPLLNWLLMPVVVKLAVFRLSSGTFRRGVLDRHAILLAVAAVLAMIQANWLVIHTANTHVSIIRLDMMRLPLGILSGAGFRGAGAIFRRGDLVRGVTTAATVWLVTVIGLCFGGGQIGLGLAGKGVAVATLWLLNYEEMAC